MSKPSVFITRKMVPDIIGNLKKQFEVRIWDSEEDAVPPEILLEEAKKVDALFVTISDKIDSNLLAQAENLKVIANMAVGYDNIDVEAANSKGIAVCNTPDVLTDTTADFTFALLMATARRVAEGAETVKQGNWQSWSPLLLAGHDIHHKTLGIIGMGEIGEAVAKRSLGFEMEILYHNRNRKPFAEQHLGAVYCSFEDLLERSDYVVCMTPLTAETENMFDAEAFRRMKDSAIFINTSRGRVVDEDALHKALVQGEIAGAGLDVFTNEPIESDHPLISLPNVLATPHMASSSIETRIEMMNLCSENISRILTGRKPKTLVNKEWLSVKEDIGGLST